MLNAYFPFSLDYVSKSSIALPVWKSQPGEIHGQCITTKNHLGFSSCHYLAALMLLYNLKNTTVYNNI